MSDPPALKQEISSDQILQMSRENVVGALRSKLIAPVDNAIKEHLIVNQANESVSDRQFKLKPYPRMDANRELVACLKQGSIS